jgi:DNA-binding NarL/FixJ family response regulator
MKIKSVDGGAEEAYTLTLASSRSSYRRIEGSMSVKVLIADDAEIMRRAIKFLLKDLDEITVVGEAADFPETVEKMTELRPDVVVIDLHMPDKPCAYREVEFIVGGPRMVAMSFGIDETSSELAERIGAADLIDKMELVEKLIPSILQQRSLLRPC